MTVETAQSIFVWASIVTAGSTAALAIFGIRQLAQLKHQVRLQATQIKTNLETEKKWRTVEACDRYLFDSVLHASTQRIWQDTKGGTDYSSCTAENHDIVQVLNYLENLAIGIKQEIYYEEIVKDSLDNAIEKAVKAFLRGEDGSIDGLAWKAKKGIFREESFPFLVGLYERWFPKTEVKLQYKNNI